MFSITFFKVNKTIAQWSTSTTSLCHGFHALIPFSVKFTITFSFSCGKGFLFLKISSKKELKATVLTKFLL